MKKLLLIAALALSLQSCIIGTDQEEAQTIAEEHFNEVEYKGHKYVVFMFSIGYEGYAGLEHDPDCPCYKTDSVNNGNDTSSVHYE